MKAIPFLAAPALALLLASCSKPAAPSASVVHLDPAGASELLAKDSGVTVLDVRTPQEHAEGRLAGTVVNIDFRAPGFEEAVTAQLDKKKPYLLHCQGGGRSSAALELLEGLGFQKLYHLDGGLGAWLDAGLPVEK